MTQTTNRLIDIQEVQRTISLLTRPGQVFEVRALNAAPQPNSDYTSTYSGYFDDVQKLQQELPQIKKASGIYITLQPVDPDLLSRAANRMKKADKNATTSDKYITDYAWLPIDCDPERPAGISSTDEEHEQALQHSRYIRDELAARGWPTPIEGDSGNGGHLLYPIALPTSDADINLVKRTLEGISETYSTPAIKIDTTVFNPARIWKLYGTLACKGDNTPRRPHRMSRLLAVPDERQTVSRDLLEAIAAPAEPPAAPRTYQDANKTGLNEPFTAENFLHKHHIAVKSADPYAGGTRYLLERCVWNSDHTDNSACVFQFADGRLGASCSHDSCHGKSWKDFRIVFEPDAYTRAARTSEKKKTEDPDNTGEQEEKESQVKRLLRISEQATYFKGSDNTLYARVPVNGHQETLTINEVNSGLKRWLTYVFYKETGQLPNKDLLSQAINAIVSIASYESQSVGINTRISEHKGKIYLDLANERWECIEISKHGWKVITDPPVFFRRSNGLLPLPTPERGGSLEELKSILNLASDEDYYLLVGWMLGTLHPRGPYPGLSFNGGQGTGKSFATVTIKNMIDPNVAPTKSSPKDERDMAIAAQNAHIIGLDNLSSMPIWLSDLLCKLATGSGFSTRKLHTDDDEKIFYACRPFVINGIEDGLISRGDLLERSILVSLQPIAPTARKTERELKKMVKEAHPRILGALLDAAVCALRELDNTSLVDLPRMADFCEWVTAAEPALGWDTGTFISAFMDNQNNASSIAIEASPVAQAIKRYMENCSKWEGMAKDLYDALDKYEDLTKKKEWPGNARALSGFLKRVAPPLLAQNIKVFFHKRNSQGSKITIEMIDGSVANVGNSVAKSAKNVANVGNSVAKFTTPAGTTEQGLSRNSVASVAKSDNLILSQIIEKNKAEVEKNTASSNENINTADFATSTSFATQKQCYEQAKKFLEEFNRKGCRLALDKRDGRFDVRMVDVPADQDEFVQAWDQLQTLKESLIQVLRDRESA